MPAAARSSLSPHTGASAYFVIAEEEILRWQDHSTNITIYLKPEDLNNADKKQSTKTKK